MTSTSAAPGSRDAGRDGDTPRGAGEGFAHLSTDQRRYIDWLQSLVPGVDTSEAILLATALSWGRESSQADPEAPSRPAVLASFSRAATHGHQDTPPTTDAHNGQFASGHHQLSGRLGKYRILSVLNIGDTSETYKAEVVEAATTSEVSLHSTVVIKVPRVLRDMSEEAANDRLTLLTGVLEAEAATLRSLKGLPNVAQLLDSGRYWHRVRFEATQTAFLVYKLVEGKSLDAFMATHVVRRSGRSSKLRPAFSGIQDAKEYFEWARRLTNALLSIHRKLVIHGDIRPSNILIDAEQKPIFIDIGQGLFAREMSEITTATGRAARYRAPEGARSVSADLFALGGVLFYLATGDEPPLPHEDREMLKKQIGMAVKAANPTLYDREWGVVDIIAHCLRYGRAGRVGCASQLLRDIEMFDDAAPSEAIALEAKHLGNAATEMQQHENSLFRCIAVFKTRQLRTMLEDMMDGVYDLTGSSDELISVAAKLLGTLEPADELKAITTPRFWQPSNIGINGRFLSMSKRAAERGVNVERILLVTEALSDDHLHEIVEAQQRIAVELNYSPHYSVRYVQIKAEEREEMIREGKHFGLFVRRGVPIAMFPVYRDNDVLVTLRFRAGDGQLDGLRRHYEALAQRSKPLADLRLPPRQAKLA